MSLKSAVSAPPLLLRPANHLDLPPLMALAHDFKNLFLDDYSELEMEDVADVVKSGRAFVFDLHGYAVGCIWFDEVLDDLHCQVHVLVRPEYLRQVLKQDFIGLSIDWAFEQLKVGKVKARTMSTEKSAIKLLRRFKFKDAAPVFKETRHNGVKVDMIHWEMRRNWWLKDRGLK